MERKGGCCIAPRYGAAAAAAGQQAGAASWQMGRIMLKFRPIAPKPAAMAPVPTPAPVPAPAAGAGRGKRKAVGGGAGGGRRGRKPKRAATAAPVAVAAAVPAVPAAVDSRKDKDCEKEKSLSSRSSSSSGMTSVDSSPPPPPPPQQQRQPTTLPLMPVSPVEEKPTVAAADATGEPASVVGAAPPAGARPAPPLALRPVPPPPPSSWVTVEEVTATWRDGEEAPCSAAASVGRGAADGDAAPAFVSDQWGRVTWTNAAFARAAVSADDDASAPAVALAGALPAWGTCAGFTCRVRVARHAAPRRSSVVAPCDVWRLDAAGCYLWRLDLQAALTLGAGGLPLRLSALIIP